VTRARDVLTVVALCAITAFAVLGAITAGLVMSHDRHPVTVTRTITRMAPSKVTYRTRVVHRTRVVYRADSGCASQAMAAYLGALQFSIVHNGAIADSANGFNPPLSFCAGMPAVAYVPPS
jgi:hypothetical protein